MRWLRALLPAAILLVGTGAGSPLAEGLEDVISLDADAVESGPLSLAHALARERKA